MGLTMVTILSTLPLPDLYEAYLLLGGADLATTTFCSCAAMLDDCLPHTVPYDALVTPTKKMKSTYPSSLTLIEP